MAKIGLEYAKVAKLTETDGTATYSDGITLGAAVKMDAAINTNKIELYADNVLAESEVEFKDGSLTLEVDDLLDDVRAYVLGHTVGDDGEVVSSSNDTSPYVGFGCIGNVKRSGVKKYRAIWFTKVQFEEPGETAQTKGESTSFSTANLTGTIYQLDSGTYKLDQTFDTLAEAKAYIDGKYATA